MLAEIYKKTATVSGYMPPQPVIELTLIAQKEFGVGMEIIQRSWDELNGYSVVERTNKDKRTFNSFVDESIDDPNEAWKWRGTRSLARNKAMAMHAYLTQEYIVPGFFAQNEGQEEDRTVSEVMQDLVEFLTINSNYRQSFMSVSLGMLVNPVTYLEANWNEVFQLVKIKNEKGYSKQQILDEVLSGFQASVYGPTEVLLTNAYQPDVQRQRTIFKVKYREYTELKQQHGDHPNWQYVQPGQLTVFSEEDGIFYDVRDDSHQFWVQEVTMLSRVDDLEVTFLGGVYMGDEDVEWNQIKHRDNTGAPRYNVVPFGYEPISEHFAFYKSLMFRVGWDDKLLDAMYEVTMNRKFLDLELPVAISGAEDVDTSVVFPGAQIASKDPNFKITPVIPPMGSDPFAGMREAEKSIDDASISRTQTGAFPDTSQRAFTVAQAARAARTILTGVGKRLGESVRQYGDLMKDIVINHLTTPHVDEISDNLIYRKFILQDRMVSGKKVSKEIRFSDELMGRTLSNKQLREKTMKLMEESGFPDMKRAIVELNPFMFSKMKYFTRVEPDQMRMESRYLEQVMMERLYSLLVNNPTIELEDLTQMLIDELKPGASSRLMTKKNVGQEVGQEGQGGLAEMMNVIRDRLGQQSAKAEPLPATEPV